MANGVEIKVISSQAIKEAYLAFQPEFERMSGHKLNTTWNGTVDALQEAARRRSLRHGDPGDAVDGDDDQGRQDRRATAVSTLVRSEVAIAVPPGAPKPDLSSVETVKTRAARRPRTASAIRPARAASTCRICSSAGVSPTRSRQTQTPPGTPVGTLLTSGEVDIGFQQVSELMLYPGIQYVGPVPEDMQHVSVFCGGVHTAAKQPEAARELIRFIVSPAALPYIKKTGMEQGAP